MSTQFRWLLIAALLAGCGAEGTPARPSSPSEGVKVVSDAGTPTSSTDDASVAPPSGSSAPPSGLPCDIANLLASRCTVCHGATLAGGATLHLNSWDDLTAPAPDHTSQSVAERCLARVRDSAAPMPPTGSRLAASDIALFEAWVNAGTPEGTCASSSGPDIFGAAPTCTSATFWTGGDKESPDMHPGRACIDCHTRGVRGERGPPLSLAGTVFATAHDPDDCNGANGRVDGVVIEITDKNGKVQRITPRSSGNFYVEPQPLATPYTARVLYQGRVRAMATPQTSGDCNSCHTAAGLNGAPGRIALP